MRVSGWSLYRRGCGTALRADNLPAGLVIVRGPNGSGKSCLAGFLADTLGQGNGTNQSWLGLPGGGVAGTVRLTTDAGDALVARQGPGALRDRLSPAESQSLDPEVAHAIEASLAGGFRPGEGPCFIGPAQLDVLALRAAAPLSDLARERAGQAQRWRARRAAMQLEAAMAGLFEPASTDRDHGAQAGGLLSRLFTAADETARELRLAEGRGDVTAALEAERSALVAKLRATEQRAARLSSERASVATTPARGDLDLAASQLAELDALLADQPDDGEPEPGHGPVAVGSLAPHHAGPAGRPVPGAVGTLTATAVIDDRVATVVEGRARASEAGEVRPVRSTEAGVAGPATDQSPSETPARPAIAVAPGSTTSRGGRLHQVARWLQPAMLAATAIGVVVAVGLLRAGASRPAVVAGALALLAAGLAFVAPTRREAEVARQRARFATPTPNSVGAASRRSPEDGPTGDGPFPGGSPAHAPADPGNGPTAETGAHSGSGQTSTRMAGVGTAARIGALASALALPSPPHRDDVIRRITEVEAHRHARDEADDIDRAAAAVEAEIVTLRSQLEDFDAARRAALAATTSSDATEASELAPRSPQDDLALMDLRLRSSVFDQRVRDAASLWQRYALARRMLLDAIDAHDLAARSPLEHQASAYLREMTAGAWTGVAIDAGGIDLVGADGNHLDARAAGRSTGNLACLALHLASSEELPEVARELGPAPLVLDDVLTGLDGERTAATVKLLCQIAERRQVLLCTSSNEVADLARRHRRGVRVVELA